MIKKDIPLNNDANTKTFSVKVPTWAWQLLNIIAESREHGTNGNDLLKKCLMFIIETAKIDGPVPAEFQTLLNMLKLDTSWHDAFNFADVDAQMDIAQIILILQQYADGKPRKGFGLVMIDKPFMGESKINYCVDDILERVTEVAMQGLYKMLRQIGTSLGSQSMRETLTILCESKVIDILDQMDAEEMPGVGVFHDFGKAIEYGNKQKSYRHRTPDSLANSQQQTICFDDDDRETADTEAVMGTGTMCSSQTSQGACPRDLDNDEAPEDDISEALGFRPFDQEP